MNRLTELALSASIGALVGACCGLVAGFVLADPPWWWRR